MPAYRRIRREVMWIVGSMGTHLNMIALGMDILAFGIKAVPTPEVESSEGNPKGGRLAARNWQEALCVLLDARECRDCTRDLRG